MKRILTSLMIFSALMVSAQTQEESKAEVNHSENDSTEYELIITEPGFNSWFATHRKPMWYHSHEYYKKYNELYVREWNFRYNSPVYDIPYENLINYDFREDYGIALEYKLYWYFRFMEHKYDIDLIKFDRPR